MIKIHCLCLDQTVCYNWVMVKDSKKSEEKDSEKSSRDPWLEQKERERKIAEILEEREIAFSEEEKTLLLWKVPARPFKKRNREYYTTIGAIVILLSLILLFAREFLLVAVIMSIAFVAYVYASVEPEEVEHEITTRGIRTGGRFFRWDELGRFWFQEKYGQKMVVLETYLNFPKHLLMLLGKHNQEEMSKILRVFVLNETPEPTALDKTASWLSEKVPLDD